MLRVFYAAIESVPDQPDGLNLSAYRLRRLSVLRPSLQRRQGIAAELLLNHAIGQIRPDLPLPLEIDAADNGKPNLSGLGLFFSLSHSGGYAACALSDRPVGLDLELRSPVRELLLRRFSPAERDYIRSSADPPAAFTELWTRKESYGKATGEGLRAFRQDLDLLGPPEDVSLWHTALEDLHLSVCVLGGSAVPDLLEKIDLT